LKVVRKHDNTEEQKMNVNINIKSATACLKSFVEKSGGQAQHSAVLELLAKMCGFDCYRAMKAQADGSANLVTPIQGQIRHTTAAPVAGQSLEDPTHVVYRATAVDWRLADDPKIGLDEVPQEQRRKYDFIVEEYGSQFRVMLKPEGIDMDSFPGQPLLDMLVEVNEGVPCVHLTNDPSDAQLLTVFGTSEGILARPDDGQWGTASRDLPDSLSKLVDSACDPRERHSAQVCILDTGKKYGEERVPSLPENVDAGANYYLVIEATSAAQRAAYKSSAEYALFARGAVNVTEGEYESPDEEGGTIYWLLLTIAPEKERAAMVAAGESLNDYDEKHHCDNVTYRINDEGFAEFWASGVEI
jgi:hypothetical protein